MRRFAVFALGLGAATAARAQPAEPARPEQVALHVLRLEAQVAAVTARLEALADVPRSGPCAAERPR